jgi:hypothetical protein
MPGRNREMKEDTFSFMILKIKKKKEKKKKSILLPSPWSPDIARMACSQPAPRQARAGPII